MKLSVGKRILMFFHWLLSLLICAAFAMYLILPEFMRAVYARLEATLGPTGIRIAGIALLAIYAALAVAQICLILKRRRKAERGFIDVDSSDTGKVRIAVSAVEQMVRQSVHSIDGIADMKIDIDSLDDSIVIGVKAAIVNGSHVPTITANMQRSIRQFVEVNCGVSVSSVLISIDAVSNPPDGIRRRIGRSRGGFARKAAAAAVPAAPAPEIEEKKDAAFAAQPPQDEPEAEQPEPAPVPASEPAPYDFDKPYESEFAKDLAAMKAREAAANSDPTTSVDPDE